MNMVSDGPLGLDLGLTWLNRFARLGGEFHTRLSAQPLPEPYWVGRSHAVARELGLAPAGLGNDELLTGLSGKHPLEGTPPGAHGLQSFAGHDGLFRPTV